LQQDGIVDDWLAMIGGLDPWPNPGKLGQYEAALAWSLDVERTNRWPSMTVPCLVLSFEHDVDSPPARAREAGAMIPGSRFVEVAGASHLGVFTHADEVAGEVVRFFTDAG
jgi:thioesterase CepJ